MDLGLARRIALVSGGSKGMGRGIAKELASEGAHVVVVARGQEAIDAIVQEIEQAGGVATGLSADLYVESGIIRAMEHCAKRFGAHPDIVVANVYGSDRFSFEETTNSDFETGYRQLVLSAVSLARHSVPSMKRQGWGRFLTVGSFCAKQPHTEIPLIIDNVGRAAATALMKSLSVEFGGDGITFNTVAPGFIETEMALQWMAQLAAEQGLDPDLAAEELNASIPLKRQGTVQEFAAMCAFLCSERASYVTGQTILVDGGLVKALY